MSERPNFSNIALYKVALADANQLQIQMIAEALEEMYEQGFQAGEAKPRPPYPIPDTTKTTPIVSCSSNETKSGSKLVMWNTEQLTEDSEN